MMALQRGGAVLALPLLLMLGILAPARHAQAGAPLLGMQEQLPDMAPHMDATFMVLMIRPDSLDDAPKALVPAFPATGGTMTLWGGGASFGKGPLRAGVQAVTGGLSARTGGLNTEWRLRLANLMVEQRYLFGAVETSAGALLTYGISEGLLEDGAKITRFDATGYGSGLVGSARWPRGTPLGFLLRAGYLWLPMSGVWKGDQAGANLRSTMDMGGPFGQAQVELGF